ncbi:MAG: Holliday junction resolvase RuvX [Porticoccaceae bacterium]
MPDSIKAAPITVIALDFGIRQIGLAVGQTLTCTAQPIAVISARDGHPDWLRLTDLVTQWEPDLLLVGLPLNMDGTESEFCSRARRFARRLHARFGISVKMVDERLSTREAKSRLPRPASYRSKPVDAIAAALTLETWFGDQRLGIDA